jgi:hypothetical protein
VTRELEIERKPRVLKQQSLRSSFKTTTFEQPDERDAGIVVWLVTVVVGDVEMQLSYILVIHGSAAGVVRHHVFLPYLTNV